MLMNELAWMRGSPNPRPSIAAHGATVLTRCDHGDPEHACLNALPNKPPFLMYSGCSILLNT